MRSLGSFTPGHWRERAAQGRAPGNSFRHTRSEEKRFEKKNAAAIARGSVGIEARKRDQTARSTISFLISAMAADGFRPLGQVRAQFMIVWQR